MIVKLKPASTLPGGLEVQIAGPSPAWHLPWARACTLKITGLEESGGFFKPCLLSVRK